MPLAKSINRPQERSQTWLIHLTWQLAIPLAFLVAMLLFFPYRGVFEFDHDEGMNLIKARLVEQGFSLYGEIWSDQPPLMTHLLANLFRFTRDNVNAARLLVLGFSSLLLWAYFQFLRLVWGNLHALLGALLLFLLPNYTQLSLSVMVGLPAITFAMLSLLALALWHSRRQDRWLVLSAAMLSLSVLTKLITGFLTPIFAVGILVVAYARANGRLKLRELFRPVVLWCGVFAMLASGLSLLMVGFTNLYQLVLPHLFSSRLDYFRQDDLTVTLAYHLRDAWAYLILATLGGIYTLRAKRWLALYPLAWLASACLLLSFHAPVWYHQALLVTIPAAMLGAGAAGEALRFLPALLRSRRYFSPQGLLSTVALLAFLLALVLHAPATLVRFNPLPVFMRSDARPTASEERFMSRIRKYAPQTHWMITDMPMYAFRAGLPVPPDLAIITAKRLLTGYLSEEEIVAAISSREPEQVLLGLFDYPVVESFLEQHYRMVHSHQKLRLYIRDDL